MAQIIAVTNQKGGVGKTTTAAALTGGLTGLGHRVLAIDMDPQGNLGFCLGVDIEAGNTTYDILKSPDNILPSIRHTEFGDIISSNILLSSAEIELNKAGREYLLKTAIEKVRHMYDYIIIDTPPALNILTVNAYVCADSLIIPMIPEILSLLGISQLKETIDTVRKYYNHHLRILGVLLVKFNKRLNLTREVEEMTVEIAKQLGTTVLEDRIRSSIAIAEAPAHGVSIMKYAPRANATLDYNSLIKKIEEGIL